MFRITFYRQGAAEPPTAAGSIDVAADHTVAAVEPPELDRRLISSALLTLDWDNVAFGRTVLDGVTYAWDDRPAARPAGACPRCGCPAGAVAPN